MSDPIRDIVRMQYAAQRQQERVQKRRERDRRRSRPVRALFAWITLLMIVAIVGGVVVGAMLLIRYGYAHKWWW